MHLFVGSFFGTESDTEGAGDSTPKSDGCATFSIDKKRRTNRSFSLINLKKESGLTPKENMERLRGQLKCNLSLQNTVAISKNFY